MNSPRRDCGRTENRHSMSLEPAGTLASSVLKTHVAPSVDEEEIDNVRPLSRACLSAPSSDAQERCYGSAWSGESLAGVCASSLSCLGGQRDGSHRRSCASPKAARKCRCETSTRCIEKSPSRMLQGERKKLRKAREHPLTARSFSPIDIVSRKFNSGTRNYEKI